MTTLTLRSVPNGRVDMTGILPETLAGRRTEDIGKQIVHLAGSPLMLDDLFDVTPDETGMLVIRTDSDRLDYLGQGMRTGKLRIDGPAGHYAAQAMTGGEIDIRGDAGEGAANGMKGGLLRIRGNAGDWLGAALIGDRAGMAGGVVAVEGDVGDRLGDRMRRGLILVRGRAGDACGARLLAGTLVVAGGCGSQPGSGLRRGSLILGRRPESLPSSFNDSGRVDLSYLGLLHRHTESLLPGLLPATTHAYRYMGDLAFGGKGEILVLA
ncbi:MAG: formylmethanofuran dehydrogenase subunit C [Thiobacillus sp. 63-78]|uniref:formylmethanofuran dehydrogenase subunit C n=1 Tax=Thiobacillus sp. 63-78 TaxID=1895859 RepID=UPI00095E2A76|nr:formylmethanofuran dehydrogenase subunit C [Thiobacillus sp. 63-78]MBN8763063.1 formylmethanofuran dehydrogenase subunit C [Thiobacillus sp.]MBN8774074.1 formylmethanofuran dehydrogenase subunit C [Thiobacillus sp.]OJZ16916.1 MAG: formylmethanofuran dehydrogenase subunit C [Thiobacillus sp. 63-78]